MLWPEQVTIAFAVTWLLPSRYMAVILAATWPLHDGQVPIAFADYESGAEVHTGRPAFRMRDDSPCGRAYRHFCAALPNWYAKRVRKEYAKRHWRDV